MGAGVSVFTGGPLLLRRLAAPPSKRPSSTGNRKGINKSTPLRAGLDQRGMVSFLFMGKGRILGTEDIQILTRKRQGFAFNLRM